MNLPKRFGQIYWGLVLALFDFQINGFDLLPDWLGYILVALGCRGLVGLSSRFQLAGVFAWMLAVSDVLGFVVPDGLSGIHGLARLAVDCAMIWFLLGGIMEFATAKDRPDLSLRASNRRLAYVGLMVGAALLGFVARGSRDAATLVLAVLIVAVVPMIVLLLHMVYVAKHELATR